MRDIRQKDRGSHKGTFEAIRDNRREFNIELVKPTSDMAKINDLKNKLKAIQSQMLDDKLNETLEIKKVLTPEQFEKYVKIERRIHHKMHRR